MVSLTVLTQAFITKYALRAGLFSTSPSSCTIRFLDANDIEVGCDTRTSEMFTTNQSQEIDISATPVIKATLTIDNIPSIVRSTTGYFMNFAGHFELATSNVL